MLKALKLQQWRIPPSKLKTTLLFWKKSKWFWVKPLFLTKINIKNTNLINKVFLNTNNPLETSLGSMDISNSHVAMVNTKVPNAMQENYTKNIISTTNTKARDSMTVNSTQSKDQYTTNDSITPVATNIMTVIACGNEEFEHAIQMSTPSTHYGQMASEPKNSIQAKSEKDIAQYNTPLHTLDMQMICQSLAHIPTLLLKIKKPRPKILLQETSIPLWKMPRIPSTLRRRHMLIQILRHHRA